MSNGMTTGRPLKIVSRFPSFMRAERPAKVIGEIAGALGADLDEAERLMFRIQQSHRLALAEEERDVLELASLLGLHGADFLILRKFYESGFFFPEEQPNSDDQTPEKKASAREKKAYDGYLGELKEAVQRIARLMLDGCGTIWALLEGTSVFINGDNKGSGSVEHPDQYEHEGGFIHRISIEYSLVDENKKRVLKTGFIYLVENPLRDRETEEKERRQREWFRVKRRGFFDGPVSVQVAGVADRCVWPMVINKGTHEGVGFRGILKEGQKLIFSIEGKVYLDSTEVTDQSYYFRGGLAAGPEATKGDDNTASVDEEGLARLQDQYCTVSPAGSLDRNYPRPTIEPLAQLPVPTLRLGESDWRFSVAEGAFDASGFDEAVFFLPESESDLNKLPASGKIMLRWQEHEPFAVRILIPPDMKSLETEFLGGEDLRKLVRAGLERLRTAGIRLEVDYYNEE